MKSCFRYAGLLLLMVLPAALVVAPGCRKKEIRPHELRIAIREPKSCDPAFLMGQNDFLVASNLFDGLFRWSGESGRVVPNLAVEFSCDESGRVWRFRIRRDSRYHDGTSVTARDFEFAWKRILTPSVASVGGKALRILKGGAQALEGNIGEVLVRALDDETLELVLEHPQPFLPQILASPRFAPLPERFGPRAEEDLVAEELPVTNGPYRIKEWKAGQRIVLESNPHHPPADSQRHPQATFLLTESEDTALTWWEAGTADVIVQLVPMARVFDLRSRFENQLVELPLRSVFYYAYNLDRSPLDTLAVRRALSAALDRQRLVRQVLGAGQEEASSFVPDRYGETIDFSPESCDSMDLKDAPALAKGLSAQQVALASKMELVSNSSETLRAILEFSQQSFADHAGIRFSLRLMEWESFSALLDRKEFDIARLSLTGGEDPVDFLDNFTSAHENNYFGYSNMDYDRLVRQVHALSDPESRKETMNRAIRILCQGLPAIPVYYSSQLYLVRQDLLSHFAPDPEGIFLLDEL